MPGVLHCGGGSGPTQVDWLAILVDWVENGKPSERVVASKLDEGQALCQLATRPRVIAALLGLPESTLRSRMKKLGIKHASPL